MVRERRQTRPDAPPLDALAPGEVTVATIMSSPVHTIAEGASALRASDDMDRHRVQHLVVINDGGRVVGVLSDRDLRGAQPSRLLIKDEAMRKKALGVIHVADLMAAHPHTVRAEDPATTALRFMLERRIGCVPVVNRHGELQGIVTGGDVIKLALALLRR